MEAEPETPGTKRRACGECGPGKLFFSCLVYRADYVPGESEILDLDMYKNHFSIIANRR
jgi:hypothetical protein